MKKFTFVRLLLTVCMLSVLLPCTAFAATTDNTSGQLDDAGANFTAKVLEVLASSVQKDDLTQQTFTQQDLKLRGLDGAWKGKEFVVKGISDIQVIGSSMYAAGDTVIVNHSVTELGEDRYYVVDYVRTKTLLMLTLLFVLVLIAVGFFKGLKAGISLLISFVIILKFIIPRILSGSDPLTVTIIGCGLILIAAVYITEGWSQVSHISVLSIVVSLLCAGALSVIFTNLAHLSGTSQEEAAFLVGQASIAINLKGLLLAGMIIGALGVLDDVIISQVVAVEQFKEANPSLSRGRIFSHAYKVGVSHIGSVVNTLFLVYAGTSLPLLVLFSLASAHALPFQQIINMEQVATEVVRTLVGSIAIILSMPISTVLATFLIRPDKASHHDHSHAHLH